MGYVFERLIPPTARLARQDDTLAIRQGFVLV
jgi:hypothetical protein